MQVLIGIISSLIVFPINLIVVQIFRNVRPKPKVKPEKQQPSPPALSFTEENLENYNQLKESSDESAKGSNNSLDSAREKNNRTRLSINDVHTDVDRASFTDSPLLIDRRLSTTFEIGKREFSFWFIQSANECSCCFIFRLAPTSRARRLLLWFKKRNTLPHYFVYVAWFLLFVFTTGSAAVVVFYGMEFKNVRSLQWLFSSCVSFVQDVFITQPLKVRTNTSYKGPIWSSQISSTGLMEWTCAIKKRLTNNQTNKHTAASNKQAGRQTDRQSNV